MAFEAILHEVDQLHNVNTRLEGLAEQDPLVSETARLALGCCTESFQFDSVVQNDSLCSRWSNAAGLGGNGGGSPLVSLRPGSDCRGKNSTLILPNRMRWQAACCGSFGLRLPTQALRRFPGWATSSYSANF